MVVRKKGSVINLASITSFLPIAYSAIYAASKSFVLSFSKALGREVAADGVHVLAVCPGPLATKFYDRIGANPPRNALDTLERIVAGALTALDRGRSAAVPGRFMIRMLVFGMRLLPRTTNARIGEGIGRQYFLAAGKAGSP
jgi:short-subunit dehydrogenase